MMSNFSLARFLVFAAVGLPLGFILTALGFTINELPISVREIFPWALGVALAAGVAGGFWRQVR